MINGPGGATIWSQDVNNLLPFYRDLLAHSEVRRPQRRSGAAHGGAHDRRRRRGLEAIEGRRGRRVTA
jgi:hypothetical protein